MGLIMLDLDGTLVADALQDTEAAKGMKLQRRQHQLYTEPVLLPNRYEILKAAAEEGDSFAIVTNQGGVAWGYHTQAEVYRRITSTIGALSCFWGQPHSVHVAWMVPHAKLSQFDGDDGRKPSPQLLWNALVAQREDGTNTRDAIMVGDRDEDRDAAEAAGVEYAHPADYFARRGRR